MVKNKVIDVSSHQGIIDWDKVKNDGVIGVIIRCGYGDNIQKQDDSQWERNFTEAKRVGLKIGVYLYSYAQSVTQAQSEANHVLRLLNGRSIDYPIFYDLEDDSTTGKCSKTVIGDMAELFCKTIKDAGYNVGIYANKYWFTNILTDPRFDKWDKWVAQYYVENTYTKPYVAWQYTSTGSVNGINGNVDMNWFYKEYEINETISPSSPQEILPNLSGYTGISIVGALNKFGFNSTYTYRSYLAEKLGIEGYRGTAQQNLQMIKMLGGEINKEPDKPREYSVYIVKKGDTLSDIADKYNTSYHNLANYNRIANPNMIYVGQKIKIPK